MRAWIARRAQNMGAEIALSDRRLIVAASVSAIAGALYVVTMSDLALVTATSAACVCALLGRAGQ